MKMVRNRTWRGKTEEAAGEEIRILLQLALLRNGIAQRCVDLVCESITYRVEANFDTNLDF